MGETEGTHATPVPCDNCQEEARTEPAKQEGGTLLLLSGVSRV